MTPIRGLLKKILGAPSDSPAAPPPREAPPAPRPSGRAPATSTFEDAPSEGGRRRGQRGGRGRNGASAAATTDAPTTTRTTSNGRTATNGRSAPTTTDSAPQSYAWGNRGNSDDQARQRREASRQRRPAGRSFRPYRENLDAPLPEDIAFRAPAEGGDPSILPSRRRRPSGLHDTARVLVGGARSLSGWTYTSGETLSPAPSNAADLTAGRPADAEPAPVEAEPAPEPTRAALLEAIAEQVVEEVAEPAESILDDADDVATSGPVANALLAVESDDIETGEEAENRAEIDPVEGEPPAVRLRRRGRRGGRGRRRPDGAPIDGPTSAHDEDDDNDESTFAVEDDLDADLLAEPALAAAAAPAPVREQRPARAPRAAHAEIDPADYPAAFAALGVSETTLQALARFRFTTPTPIQERAIPALLEGKDVVGVAQTGSGKTIAFGVPMAEQLDRDLGEVQGLVLVPTRELAQQVLQVLSELAAPWGLEAVGILGGHSLASDFKALERRPAIVVGTPGRVIDHLERGTLSLRHVHYAVLDEADQMLDIGFLPAIRRILSRTPRARQTALFSATMPSTIRRLIWQFMKDPETVTVDPELSTVDTIDQVFFEVASRDKSRGLRELLESELKGRTLVFCKMKRSVDRLEQDLVRQGVRVGALHGDMDQRHRDRVVQEFRHGGLDVLIATNVAARGLDIPEITHVVNFDVPQNAEEYVHRIGRTGRAGRDGKAITFVSEWDMGEWDGIKANFPEQIRQEQLAIYAR